MTGTADRALAPYLETIPDPLPEGLPAVGHVVAPRSVDEAAAILAIASRHGLSVLVWGGGTHQGYGHPVRSDVVLLTTEMRRVVEWLPDDLTVLVDAGVPVAELTRMLDERSQTPVLPEHPGDATVGGVVAAGISGWGRLRYGPVRDRVLQVVIVTGDGRVVTGGGRVVKNVTGYDLPRLATGSLGSLGVIATVCLKLWPRPSFAASIAVSDPVEALAKAYRPLAVLETDAGSWVYLTGTEAEVVAQARALGGAAEEGLGWPDPLDDPGVVVVRVPPRLTPEAVRRVRSIDGGVRFRAAHGVGEVRVGLVSGDGGPVAVLRRWAESHEGSVVLERAADGWTLDPWGAPPGSVDLQAKVKAAFDPAGVVNPGRLPGGI